MFLYKSTQFFCFFTKIWFSTYVIFYNDSNKYSLASIHTTTPSTQCFEYYQKDKDIYCRFPLLHPNLLLIFTLVNTYTKITNPTLYLINSGKRFPNHCIWPTSSTLDQNLHPHDFYAEVFFTINLIPKIDFILLWIKSPLPTALFVPFFDETRASIDSS